MGVVPHPITDIFALNNERHNYNTRQTHDLQINTGRGEIVYKLFNFHGVHILNHISQKVQLMYHTLVFLNLTKTYPCYIV